MARKEVMRINIQQQPAPSLVDTDPEALAETQKNLLPMPQLCKLEKCGKCGREISVGKNVVLAYCRECSAGLGVKR
jgi:hypothetical protein